MITQCCMQALYDLGPEGQAAVDLAKEFERRKCSHFKVRPQDECMTIMAGTFSFPLYPALLFSSGVLFPPSERADPPFSRASQETTTRTAT